MTTSRRTPTPPPCPLQRKSGDATNWVGGWVGKSYHSHMESASGRQCVRDLKPPSLCLPFTSSRATISYHRGVLSSCSVGPFSLDTNGVHTHPSQHTPRLPARCSSQPSAAKESRFCSPVARYLLVPINKAGTVTLKRNMEAATCRQHDSCRCAACQCGWLAVALTLYAGCARF